VPLYLILDDAGVVVRVSYHLEDADESEWGKPRVHAARFLLRLNEDEAFAGRWVLEKVLKSVYATEIRRLNIRPLPWPSVRRHLSRMLGEIEKMSAPPGGPFKTYKWVNECGGVGSSAPIAFPW
jgi:hypothetical protein